MVILITKNSQTDHKDSVEWKHESELQGFVVENTQIIFSKLLDKDIKICVIGKELVNENGRADIILLDQNGSLYIVEAKLDSNTGKRQMFAQLLGYLSAISTQNDYPNFGNFIKDCEESIKSTFGFMGNFDEYVQKEFNVTKKDVEQIKNNLKKNIEKDSVYGLFVMDLIENSLKNDIDYFLRRGFNFCGIELQKYSALDISFIVPQYHGLEKLNLTEKRDPKWYREHEEGWHLFNAEIQNNSELDVNTKKSILKITNVLENISNSSGWIRKANKTLEPYFQKFSDSDDLVLKISINGNLTFHLQKTFKDQAELNQEFKMELSILTQSLKGKLEPGKNYNVPPELWMPKIDEFIALFEKFYS